MKRFVFGLGLTLAAVATTPAKAVNVPDACSPTDPIAQLRLDASISQQLSSLRMFNEFGQLHHTLSGSKHLIATCTATCNPDGSGTYSQTQGCTYTQSCKGNPTGGGTPKPTQT